MTSKPWLSIWAELVISMARDELNEAPALARGVETPLEEGMVLAVEPKLVFPGLGGVGVENSYVVRAGGAERLTSPDDEPVRIPA